MRAVCGLVLLAACAAPPARGQEPNAKQLLAAVEKQLKDSAAAAGPSIATVVVSRSERYPKSTNADAPGRLGGFDPKEFVKNDPSPERAALARALDLSDVKAIPDHGYAGGVVIDAPAGLVLTPYHVIDGATKVFVFLPGGGSYADIHAADARSDLAVLKLLKPPPKMQAIKRIDVRTVRVGGREPTVETGTLCVLMAKPYSSAFGLDPPGAAFGSLSNVRHKFPKPEGGVFAEPQARHHTEYGTLLEYDLKLTGARGGLNAGMTGGVLLNLDGEMIGLTNAAAVAWGNDVGPGYAVAADEHFRRIVESLQRGEEVEYGFLGVRPRRDAGPTGVEPIAGGAAARGGMISGDAITRVNGIPVSNFDDLLLHIGSALAGSKTELTVNRFGREVVLTVTLGKFTHGEPFIASARPAPVFGLRVEYPGIDTDRMKQELIPAGVLVREVAADSPAEKGLKTLGDNPKRWVITHVNGAAVTTPAEFYKAAKGQEKIKLSLIDPKDDTIRRELTLP